MIDAASRPRRQIGRSVLVDVASLVIALAAGALVWTDSDLFVRPVVALAFIVFVPGWMVLRLAAVPVTSLMVLSSFVLSVVLMVCTSFLLATRLNWIWDPVARLWTFGSALGLAVLLIRPDRPNEERS